MHPGISEDQAKIEAAEVFHALGMERLWHPVLIRIGPNTTKTYRQRSDSAVRLGENDSYFIDLGLVFDGYDPGYRVIDALDVHVTLLANLAADRVPLGRA